MAIHNSIVYDSDNYPWELWMSMIDLVYPFLSWIIDIHGWIMDIHHRIMNMHNKIMDIPIIEHNYG